MKTLSTKIIASVFVIALATTGCSSIADAGLAEQPTDQAVEQITPPAPDVDPLKGDAEAEVIVDKPF